MAVRRSSKGNENGGAARGRDFRGGNRSSAANDDVGPAEALRHVRQKGHHLRQDFAPRISGTHRVMVALAGLMHDAQLVFSRGQAVHGIHKHTVDRQSALAAARNEQAQGISGLARRNRKEFRTHRASRNHRLFSPRLCRNFIAGGNALRKTRQQFVREAWLRVGLKDDIRHAPEPGGQ